MPTSCLAPFLNKYFPCTWKIVPCIATLIYSTIIAFFLFLFRIPNMKKTKTKSNIYKKREGGNNFDVIWTYWVAQTWLWIWTKHLCHIYLYKLGGSLGLEYEHWFESRIPLVEYSSNHYKANFIVSCIVEFTSFLYPSVLSVSQVT